jgi:hypothetical protein
MSNRETDSTAFQREAASPDQEVFEMNTNDVPKNLDEIGEQRAIPVRKVAHEGQVPIHRDGSVASSSQRPSRSLDPRYDDGDHTSRVVSRGWVVVTIPLDEVPEIDMVQEAVPPSVDNLLADGRVDRKG